MKSSIPVVLVGIVAGVAGALIASRFSRPAPASAAPPEATAARLPRPVIIPPGWDANLVARVARLEEAANQRQAETKPAVSDAGAAPTAGGPDPIEQRAQERLEHYQKELSYREEFIDKHNQEPVDSAWSQTTNQSLHEQLVAAETRDGAKLKQVDCRSKTCIATLEFPTPSDALTYVQAGGKTATSAAAKVCNGSIMIPTPPTGAGSYDLTVLYTCR